jgi:hypothetical protein
VLWPYKVPVVVLFGHQPSWLSPGRSVAGAAYAGLLFHTLVYAEKVRAQFLSLRQLVQWSEFSERTLWQLSPIHRACFGSGSELSAGRIAPLFSDWAIFLRTLDSPRLVRFSKTHYFELLAKGGAETGWGILSDRQERVLAGKVTYPGRWYKAGEARKG